MRSCCCCGAVCVSVGGDGVVMCCCYGMVNYSICIFIVRVAELRKMFRQFSSENVFLLRPMKVVNFHRKNGETPKLVVHFFGKKTHSEKFVEIVVDFIEKKLQQQQQQQTLEFVEDFACEDKNMRNLGRFRIFSSCSLHF